MVNLASSYSFQEGSPMRRLIVPPRPTLSLLHIALAWVLLSSCTRPAQAPSPAPAETATPTATVTSSPVPAPTTAPTATAISLSRPAAAPTATATSLPAAAASQPGSRPGEYQDYSPPPYSDWIKTSQYVAMRDGTRLAVNIFRPAQGGQAVQDALPVIWAYQRFQHAVILQGREFTELDRFPYLKTLLQHGYIIAAADARGSGASYGTSQGLFTPQEMLDTYDLTEWFAAQPWCNKNVGMYGKDYAGTMQYLAASIAPPHLKAIMPEMAPADSYAFIYPGGVIHDALISSLSVSMQNQDQLLPAIPVDEDRDGNMRDAAIQQHALNVNIAQIAWGFPYRNSADTDSGLSPYLDGSPLSYVEQIRQSQVAIYHIVGWFDLFTRDGFLMFNALDNPQKLIASSWEWEAENSFDFTNERLRWYDYWLKGIPNGIMDEPPVRYFSMSAPRGSEQEWQLAQQWPLPDQKTTLYYFQIGPSGSVKSANDGVLDIQPPDATARDEYLVDYTTSSGQRARWTTGGGPEMDYGDMTGNDEKGLTFTSPPLDSDLQVTGHPIAHLWITSSAKEVDFFVYLEDVSSNGYSRYVSEGVLRASHRAVTALPYGNLDLPYHRSYKEDVTELPAGEPVELIFDLFPTSNIFRAGHRIRVTITGADSGNAQPLGQFPPPTITLYRNAKHASYVSLPVIPAQVDQTRPGSTPTVTVPSRQQALTSFANHLNYLLYLPQGYGADPNRKWPLILFLHGWGEVGNDPQDLERVLKHGIPKNLEQGADLPFIVVSPQLPAYALWESQLDALNGLLDEVSANYAVDAGRIYLTGISRGGSGTWSLAIKYPYRFAAIAPIASYGDPSQVCALRDVPVWAFHNAEDPTVALQGAEQMVTMLRSCGGDVQFTVYPSAEHDSWTQSYANPHLYTWFLSHSRAEPAAATPGPAASPTVKP
jgi:putative CocE/NonD family hydrolase